MFENLTSKQKRLYILAGVLLLFIITNPSTKAFKDHTGARNYSRITKDYDFFVCSVYSYGMYGSYLGILGNFISLN